MAISGVVSFIWNVNKFMRTHTFLIFFWEFYQQEVDLKVIGLSQKRLVWSKPWCLVFEKTLKTYDLGGGGKSCSTICQVWFTLKLDYDLRGVNRTVWFAKYDLPLNQILIWGVNRTVWFVKSNLPSNCLYDLPPPLQITESDLPCDRRVWGRSRAKDLFTVRLTI